jgi:hypothetical protein
MWYRALTAISIIAVIAGILTIAYLAAGLLGWLP